METVQVDVGDGRVTTIDAGDRERVCAQLWRVDAYGPGLLYVRARSGSPAIFLHRFILDAPDAFDVDHRDGDGLNNTRANLRLATRQHNAANARLSARNKTGYKGVSLTRDSAGCPFTACVVYQKRTIHLGYFANAEEAARAYDAKAVELFGEYARTNAMLGLLS